MRFLAELAWRDLRESGRSLWVFCLCLMLGVTLIAATGGLYRQVEASLLADSRALFGGDLEVESREALAPEVLDWIRARGSLSLLIEVRTMLGNSDGDYQLVELQSADRQYPLYGELLLEPAQDLVTATGLRDGRWGVALDPVLAQRLGLGVGDSVEVGALTLEVRALIRRQPDRRLSADWRGPPVLLAAPALNASGLIGPGSRLEYEYRIRTDLSPAAWRDAFVDAFPDSDWEIHTFSDRSERLAEVLGQIASGLLLIGFSALFIGGLGVFNSIQAYLQGKLPTIATLRALGLRNRRLATVYLLQVGLLGGVASLAGMLVGGALAMTGSALVAQRLQLAASVGDLTAPLATAGLFGLLTAFTFALPAVGRALSVPPATLFRGIAGAVTATPPGYWVAAGVGATLVLALVLLTLPDPLFGLGFVLAVLILPALFDGLVLLLRKLAGRLDDHRLLVGRLALRLALASLRRPGSPLRAMLLSLGSALTLLVACTLVVVALMRALNDTLPEEAPAMVFYDIATDQRAAVVEAIEQARSLERLDLAPLVLGRLVAVNGERLEDSSDRKRALEARDEHKFSHRANNIDAVVLERGEWRSRGDGGLPAVVMEDREADQLALGLGDRLTFMFGGEPLEAELTGIYRQKGMQTRFWFEAILAEGALDPYISRYVGAAYLDHGEAIATQNRIAAIAPNVVTVRTEAILTEARALLGKAAAGLSLVAAISLGASLLVLVSLVATAQARQVYIATLMHTLGVRLAVIRRSLLLEFLLLGLISSTLALLLGAALALPLLEYRIKLPASDLLWAGALTALVASACCLSLGVRYLLRRIKLSPAALLRSGG
ncbi:glycosyl transferase family 1 [Marinobacterium nitratireducens]|uniref:Glycosyl transferase family 1 n=1 Tax=Marinobacterium nitratireducens TaxID=518897 RepID=A0A917ZEU5_9GAMM|nr:FtsX-like permease family protein [Marinobacterium nitratireducens]GGO81526.1 glycosyl transferase family 1 [Marinobacterium nitratireducens]